MRIQNKLTVAVCVAVISGVVCQSACAGPPYRSHYHSRGSGTSAAIGFLAGAVVGSVLSSPPPPPVVMYPHPYDPYFYGPGYYHAPPVVHREIIYRDRPTPVYVQPTQEKAPVPVAPSSTSYQMVSQPGQMPNGVPANSFAGGHQQAQRQNSAPSLPKQPASHIPVGRPGVGTVVDRLPPMAGRSERNGVLYFEEAGVFYLPIRVGNEPKFVVVQP